MSKESRKKAMYLLQKQDRTEAQLRDKLKQSGFDEDDTTDAIVYVKSFHYLDDERFARNYIRCGSDNKSKQKLKMALLQKGVAQDVIDIALEEEFQGDEAEQIRNHLKKKGFSLSDATNEQREKMIASLYRKGFRMNDIKSVMGRMDDSFSEE